MKLCNKCNSVVEPETDKELIKEYPYYCPEYDENLYSFEVTEVNNEILCNHCNKPMVGNGEFKVCHKCGIGYDEHSSTHWYNLETGNLLKYPYYNKDEQEEF